MIELDWMAVRETSYAEKYRFNLSNTISYCPRFDFVLACFYVFDSSRVVGKKKRLNGKVALMPRRYIQQNTSNRNVRYPRWSEFPC